MWSLPDPNFYSRKIAPPAPGVNAIACAQLTVIGTDNYRYFERQIGSAIRYFVACLDRIALFFESASNRRDRKTAKRVFCEHARRAEGRQNYCYEESGPFLDPYSIS